MHCIMRAKSTPVVGNPPASRGSRSVDLAGASRLPLHERGSPRAEVVSARLVVFCAFPGNRAVGGTFSREPYPSSTYLSVALGVTGKIPCKKGWRGYIRPVNLGAADVGRGFR